MPENHAAAEYYELLVAHEVAVILGVPVNVDEASIRKGEDAAGPGASRESQRAPDGAVALVSHLSQMVPRVSPLEVVWTGGGARSSSGTAADIEIAVGTGKHPIGYQLKSVGAGLGTMRNPYNETLMALVGADSSEITDRALAQTLGLIESMFGSEVCQGIESFSQVYSFSKKIADPKQKEAFRRRAKEEYEPVKAELVGLFCEAFNAMAIQEKADLMLGLMGVVPGQPLFMLVHDDAGARIMSHHQLADFLKQEDLRAEPQTRNSLKIFANELEAFRLNSSASNGQGISTPAWRVFYGSGANQLLTVLASN